MTTSSTAHRRRFLRFLAASPLFAEAWAQQTWPVITSAKDAVDVMDFEEAARKVLPPAHWGYMASGVDDDFTQKMNREGFKRFQLRPRRLVDGSKPDLKTEIFGVTWETPIFLCPRRFHPPGGTSAGRRLGTEKSGSPR